MNDKKQIELWELYSYLQNEYEDDGELIEFKFPVATPRDIKMKYSFKIKPTLWQKIKIFFRRK